MLSFVGSLKAFVAVGPRQRGNGLHAPATERLQKGSQTKALFAFTNRRRNEL